VPSTGAWQKFQSVVKDITMPKGQHYFKIVTVTGGFNINYFEIQKDFVSVSLLNSVSLKIYPNASFNGIIVKSEDFKYENIQILDLTGRTILNKSIDYTPELHLPVDLNRGVYLVRVCNGSMSYSRKLNIVK
jgi:hypothetical protein